jgi:hypothetical protein
MSASAHRTHARSTRMMVVAAVLACVPLGSFEARAAAFIDNTVNPAIFGNPLAPANNFIRYQQAAINYAFAPAFVGAYGAAGQAAVVAAMTSWNAAVATAVAPGANPAANSAAIQAGDPRVKNFPNHDLQSVALHEIGHTLGLHHTDTAGAANNYNVVGGAWVAGAEIASPIMHSTIAPNLRIRTLTNDDLAAAQFLYDAGPAGNGQGNIGGPVFGNGAVAFTLTQVPIAQAHAITVTALPWVNFVATCGAGILACVTPASINTNASAGNWGVITSGTIFFPIPEPSTIVLLGLGILMLRLHPRRGAL